jgi:hypothetical protein
MGRWSAEANRLGESLGRFTCIVVAGNDPDATIEVARGIADVQSAFRTVVIGDLFGDSPGFAPMLSEDSHGLTDVLQFGVSLGRVLRRVAGYDRLFFAPTGSYFPGHAELFTHPRWPDLIAASRALDHFLVLAAPVDATNLEELVELTDGVILVGAMTPAQLDAARVIAAVEAPQLAPMPGKRVEANSRARQIARPREPAPPNQPGRRKLPGLTRTGVVGLAFSALLIALVVWLAARPLDHSLPFDDSEPAAATPDAASPLLTPRPALETASVPEQGAGEPSDPGPAEYAVQIMAANTQAGAILKLQENGQSLPAATYSPVEISGRTWYKVLAGAFTSRDGADSLLASLRTDKLLDSTEGVVVRVPFALRIDSLAASATVSDALAGLRAGRQLPAYALQQSDGWVWVLVGAFETAAQADLYAETLRSVGLSPHVVYRQGRIF